jgi:hypothetical protein
VNGKSVRTCVYMCVSFCVTEVKFNVHGATCMQAARDRDDRLGHALPVGEPWVSANRRLGDVC